jgi:hypothetical protein
MTKLIDYVIKHFETGVRGTIKPPFTNVMPEVYSAFCHRLAVENSFVWNKVRYHYDIDTEELELHRHEVKE